ncbi:TetR-like C-terminal domain-containing protein [Subtercola boreus]|nr:TetR-like C-terminal domain-containing protein [Subtercola boreus]
MVLVTVARQHPHRYTLMFSTPSGDPTAAIRAAGRTQDLFLSLVAELVGPEEAIRFGAILLASAHGIAGLELSGHLSVEKWHTTAEMLIDDIIALLPTTGGNLKVPCEPPHRVPIDRRG